jgi:hypothetical protein
VLIYGKLCEFTTYQHDNNNNNNKTMKIKDFPVCAQKNEGDCNIYPAVVTGQAIAYQAKR